MRKFDIFICFISSTLADVVTQKGYFRGPFVATRDQVICQDSRSIKAVPSTPTGWYGTSSDFSSYLGLNYYLIYPGFYATFQEAHSYCHSLGAKVWCPAKTQEVTLIDQVFRQQMQFRIWKEDAENGIMTGLTYHPDFPEQAFCYEEPYYSDQILDHSVLNADWSGQTSPIGSVNFWSQENMSDTNRSPELLTGIFLGGHEKRPNAVGYKRGLFYSAAFNSTKERPFLCQVTCPEYLSLNNQGEMDNLTTKAPETTSSNTTEDEIEEEETEPEPEVTVQPEYDAGETDNPDPNMMEFVGDEDEELPFDANRKANFPIITVRRDFPKGVVTVLDIWFNATTVANLLAHGCWCHKLHALKSDYVGGPNTVDDLDFLCKQWFQARRCIRIQGGRCKDEPRGEIYGVADKTRCSYADTNTSCDIDACRIDAKFSEEIEMYLNYETDWEVIDGSAETCPNRDPNAPDVQKKCVGTTPDVKMVPIGN